MKGLDGVLPAFLNFFGPLQRASARREEAIRLLVMAVMKSGSLSPAHGFEVVQAGLGEVPMASVAASERPEGEGVADEVVAREGDGRKRSGEA